MVQERLNSSSFATVSDKNEVFQPEIVLRQSGVLPSRPIGSENEVFQSEIEKEIVKLFGEFDMMTLYDYDQTRVRKVKELVEKYQTITQEVIVKLHEKTLEVKTNELDRTKEELQLAKSKNLTLSKRIQELEMAGNEVGNQKKIIESFDKEEGLEKSELLEPLKYSKKGNAEEKKSINKRKRKQSSQENENEFEESKRKRKYRCDTCKKQYSKSSNLHRHIASVHKGLKPFSCPSCEYKCDSKTGLKTHIAGVHEGLKPFKCQTCDSNFASKRCLQKHISNVHDGEKPFKCELCEYACAAKYSLDKHIKSTHGKNINTC